MILHLEDYLSIHLEIDIQGLKVPRAKDKQDIIDLFMLGAKDAGWPNTTACRFLKQFKNYEKARKPYRWYLKGKGLMFCYKCKNILPITEIVSCGHTYCKSCDNIRSEIYKVNNKEKVKETRDRHYLKFKAQYIARNAKRRAIVLQALPVWADLKLITKFYKERPEGYHVDHIIPLVHPKVCGLHVIDNLQYLLAEENFSKSNKFDI